MGHRGPKARVLILTGVLPRIADGQGGEGMYCDGSCKGKACLTDRGNTGASYTGNSNSAVIT